MRHVTSTGLAAVAAVSMMDVGARAQSLSVRPVLIGASPGEGQSVDAIIGGKVLESGQVLLTARLGQPHPSNNSGVWWWGGSGAAQRLAFTGDAVPGHDGLTFSGVHYAQRMGISDAGEIVFQAKLTPGNADAIVRVRDGAYELLARQGVPFPGTSQSFGQLNLRGVNGDGLVVFTAPFQNPTSQDGAYIVTAEGVRTVAQVGQQAPGFPPGALFTSAAATGFDAQGRVIVSAHVRGGGIVAPSFLGLSTVWVSAPGGAGAPGNLQLLMRERDPAPGLAGRFLRSVHSSGVTDDGWVLVFSWLGSTPELFDGGMAYFAARDGVEVPLAARGEMFDAVNPPIVCGGAGDAYEAVDGHIWFEACGRNLIGRGVDVTAVPAWGAQAPGFDAGLVIRSWRGTPKINRRGLVMFAAGVGTATQPPAEHTEVVWSGHGSERLRVLLKEGDRVAIGPGDERTITELASHDLNDAGDALLSAKFADGSVAAFVVNAEPCAADFSEPRGATLQDLLDFLAAWYPRDPAADIDGSGAVSLDDLLGFLAAWFAGCE